MGLVSTSRLSEGMILADDLSTPAGRKILGRGTSLSEKHISMMKVWGIAFADVEGLDQEELLSQERSLMETMDRSDSIVRSFFPSHQDGGPCSEIFHLCRERCARLIEEEDSDGLSDMTDHRRPEELPSREGLPVDKPRLSEIIGGDVPLGSLPDIYFKIREVIQSPVSSATSIARVVGTDPNLSLRLLRLVNSAFYGFPTPIRSISRAVAIVGIKELSSLALAVSTMNAFDHIPSSYVDMRSFWKHSVTCGVLARIFASRRKIRRDDHFFLAGLLHDVGRAILYVRFPSHMSHGLGVSRFFRLPLTEVERRLVGFDHGQVTFRLLESWRIPEPILGMASWHHEPLSSENPDETSLLWIADWMANAMKIGSSGTFYLPPLDEELWELTGIHKEELRSVFDQAERQIEEILRIFFIA